jgi:tetratricopeptide (TPR) repeat protein
MGVVYQARHLALKRLVALKMILAGAHAGPGERARFRAEAEALARLQHPNLVQIFEVGEQDGRPYLSLEYVDGGSLARKLEGSPLPALQAAALVETLARAVHYAHERGIVHRDLKPGNILLASGGPKPPDNVEPSRGSCPPLADCIPKVSDFGLAKHLGAETGQTASGQILGTPSYMAPEQAGGKNQQTGPAADTYALGAILYEVLTGRPPFQGETPLETVRQVLTEEPIPPSRLQPGVPRDLETVCLKCLEKDPRRRYATALGLADDLRRFLRDEPIVARPAGAAYRFGKFARRNKVLVGGAAAVFLALVAGIIGTSAGLWQAQRERDRALKAEGEARGLLAASYANTARLAMQRGAWRTALANWDDALQAGHADTVGLALDKVRAWCAVHEVPKAVQEIQALSQRTDLGGYEGSVLLWQADIALGRPGNDEQALATVRQALARGLSAAEESYARGLLAESSPAALGHFERVLELDPFHHRANGMAGLLLLHLGRLPEARARAAVAELLFPEDPTFPLLQAWISANEGDMAAAYGRLDKVRAQLTAPQVETARAIMDLLHQIRQAEGLVSGDPNASLAGFWLKLMPSVLRVSAAVQALRDEGAGSASGLLLPIPPVLFKAFSYLPNMAQLLLGGNNADEVLDALRKAARAHPEGILYFVQGQVLILKDRWAEAEPLFLKAAETPSVVPLRRAALFLAIAAEYGAGGANSRAPDRALLKRAVDHTRELVALGGVRPDQAVHLAQVALTQNEPDLAAWILADWERQAPGDPDMLRKRLALEVKTGAHGRAIQTADQILKRKPRDGEALRLRAVAVDRLRQSARPFAQVAPGSSP